MLTSLESVTHVLGGGLVKSLLSITEFPGLKNTSLTPSMLNI